jgi:hypothetical protein
MPIRIKPLGQGARAHQDQNFGGKTLNKIPKKKTKRSRIKNKLENNRMGAHFEAHAH